MTSISHFDQAANSWEQRPISQQLASSIPAAIEQAIILQPQQRLLDFGAGTGLLSAALATQVAEIVALDTSDAMLAVLAEKQLPNVRIVNQDIFAGLADQFDGVVSCMAVHHVADTAGLFQVFFQQLVSGGFIAIADLDQEDGSFHGDNEGKGVKHLGFDRQQLTTILQDIGYQDIAFNTAVNIEKDGRSYPVFLLIARKP